MFSAMFFYMYENMAEFCLLGCNRHTNAKTPEPELEPAMQVAMKGEARIAGSIHSGRMRAPAAKGQATGAGSYRQQKGT